VSKSRTAEARAVAVTAVAAVAAATGAMTTEAAGTTVVTTVVTTEAMTVVMTVTVVATDPDPGVVDVMTAAGSHLVDPAVAADRPQFMKRIVRCIAASQHLWVGDGSHVQWI